MSDERADEFFAEIAKEINLIPMTLVHMPCGGYLGIFLTQLYGHIRIALEHKPFRSLKVYHGKYLTSYAKGQGGFIKGKVLRSMGQGQTIFSYALNIHMGIDEKVNLVKGGLLLGEEATLESLYAMAHIVGHEDGAPLVSVIAHHDGAAFTLYLLGTSIDGALKEGETLLAYPEHSGLKHYLVGVIDGRQKVGIHIGYDYGDALKDVMTSHIQEIARLAHVEEREIGIIINMPKLVHIGEAKLSRKLVFENCILLVLHSVGLLEERLARSD